MQDDVQVRSLEECIKLRKLFLVHVGHSWFIIRVPMDDRTMGSAVPLPVLNKLLPKAALINTISEITDVATLKRYMEMQKVHKDHLIEQLNEPLPDTEHECRLTLGIRSWGG